MKMYFFPGSQASKGSEISATGTNIPLTWRRPLAIVAALFGAAILHSLLWLWYTTRPQPLPLMEAAPLAMIDIALSAPAAPALTQPLTPPPPVPPREAKKPDPKPVKKPKPKPVHKESEIKRVEEKKEKSEAAPETPPAPAAPVAPVAPTHDHAASPRNSVLTPASANANYLNNPKPVYPAVARSRHWEGLVLLRVHVTAEGECDELSVQQSSSHETLDESALAAVRKWRFVPAKRGDVPQASWVTVPIKFQLE
jgi:periplasmic protein TonB